MFNDLEFIMKKNKKLILKSLTKIIDKNNFIFDQNVDKLKIIKIYNQKCIL